MAGGLGGGWSIVGSGSVGNWTVIYAKGIVAFAGGGQVGATELPTQVSGSAEYRVDTAAANNASVKPSTLGAINMQLTVLNRAGNGNSIIFYPFGGTEDILMPDDSSVSQIEIADGNQLTLFMYDLLTWTIQ